MTEQSHDYSDHPMSVDQKMIATLVELDVVTENYIRHEMGDEEYESYLAHEQTERKLNKIIKEQGIATTTPNEVMKQRAAEIARELVEPGEGISASVDQRAGEVALNEWKDTIRKGENSLYLQVYGEVSDQIEQVVDQDIAIEYPGMHLTRAHEGILSFSDDIAMGGPQLQIIISNHLFTPPDYYFFKQSNSILILLK